MITTTMDEAVPLAYEEAHLRAPDGFSTQEIVDAATLAVARLVVGGAVTDLIPLDEVRCRLWEYHRQYERELDDFLDGLIGGDAE